MSKTNEGVNKHTTFLHKVDDFVGPQKALNSTNLINIIMRCDDICSSMVGDEGLSWIAREQILQGIGYQLIGHNNYVSEKNISLKDLMFITGNKWFGYFDLKFVGTEYPSISIRMDDEVYRRSFVSHLEDGNNFGTHLAGSSINNNVFTGGIPTLFRMNTITHLLINDPSEVIMSCTYCRETNKKKFMHCLMMNGSRSLILIHSLRCL